MRDYHRSSRGKTRHRKRHSYPVQPAVKWKLEQSHGSIIGGDIITCTLAAKNVVFLGKNRELREALLAIEDFPFGEVAMERIRDSSQTGFISSKFVPSDVKSSLPSLKRILWRKLHVCKLRPCCDTLPFIQ